MQAEHLCQGQSGLTGRTLDGMRAGMMATANAVAREILEDAAVSASDFLLPPHADHLRMSGPQARQEN